MKPMPLRDFSVVSVIRRWFSVRGVAVLYLWVVTIIAFLCLRILKGIIEAMWSEFSSKKTERDTPDWGVPDEHRYGYLFRTDSPRPVSDAIPDSLGSVPIQGIGEILIFILGVLVICAVQIPGWLLLLWRWRCLPPALRQPDFWPHFSIWVWAVSCLWISTSTITAHYGFDLYLLAVNPEYVFWSVDTVNISGFLLAHFLLILCLLAFQAPFWLTLWLLRRPHFLTGGSLPQILAKELTKKPSHLHRILRLCLSAAFVIAAVCFFWILFDTFGVLTGLILLFMLFFLVACLVYLLFPSLGMLWWVWCRGHRETSPSHPPALGWLVGFLWVPFIVVAVVESNLTYLTHFEGYELYTPADMEGFSDHLWTGVAMAQGLGWLALLLSLWWHRYQSKRLADAPS